MKFYLLILFTLISIQLSAQHIEEFEQILAVSELQEDFKLLKSELEEKHPGLYLYTDKPKLDSIFKSIENSLNVEMSPMEFYRIINKLNSTIRDAHTNIRIPQTYSTAMSSSLKRFPFQLYTVDNKSYILENYSKDSSILIGSEVIEINNVPIAKLMNIISTGMTRDGYNTTSVSYLLDNYFSILYARMIGCPESYVIKLKNLSDSIITKTVHGLYYNELLENGLRKRNEKLKKIPALSYKVVDKNMIVSLKSFQPVSIKGDTNTKYKKAFKNIFHIILTEGLERLVIDIRDNGGGWPEVADEFLSYLVPHEFIQNKSDKAKVCKIENKENYVESVYIKHFNRQQFKKNKDGFYHLKGAQSKQKPKKRTFTGEVVVLINGGCWSQSGAFSGLIDEHVKVSFIGEETGANRKIMCGGDIIQLVLKHSKILVDIPLRVLEINTNNKNDGHGLIPNVILKPSLKQKIKGEDIILIKALEMDFSN